VLITQFTALLHHFTPLIHHFTALLQGLNLQHYFTTLIYSGTSQPHFSVLFHNIILQHHFTALLHSLNLQRYLLQSFILQRLLFSAGLLQHYFTTLIYSVTSQHHFTALLHSITYYRASLNSVYSFTAPGPDFDLGMPSLMIRLFCAVIGTSDVANFDADRYRRRTSSPRRPHLKSSAQSLHIFIARIFRKQCCQIGRNFDIWEKAIPNLLCISSSFSYFCHIFNILKSM
jgi:hypothetical protein